MHSLDINQKPRVFICSPYRGNIERNVRYAQAAMADSLARGEAPFVSHLLYTQVLDDDNECSRGEAIHSSYAYIDISNILAVYDDFDISQGMADEIARAKVLGKIIAYRQLPDFVA